MQRSRYLPLLVCTSLLGCGFHSSGDDLSDPANAGTGVPLDAASGVGGTGGSSGSGGTSGTGGGASGAAGFGGAAGIGGASGAAGEGGASGSGGAGGTGGGVAGAAGGPAGAGGAAGQDAGVDAGSPEDCTNGVDDNADGLIDCADPFCVVGYVCVPKAPNGWSEPGYVAEGTPTAPSFDCGEFTTFGKPLFGGLSPEPPQCPCRCGDPQGGVCDASGVLWENPACGGGATNSTEACQPIPAAWRIGAVQTYELPPSVQGTCEASFETIVPPPKWSVKATLCLSSVAGGGCGANALCMPRPPAGADAHVCIASAGNKGCVADYGDKRVYHEGVEDTRACSLGGCWCGGASGQVCQGEYKLYSDASCQQEIFSAPNDGQCHDTGLDYGDARSDRIVLDAISGGQCPPQGSGAPSGSVLPVSPHTVCCMPAPVP